MNATIHCHILKLPRFGIRDSKTLNSIQSITKGVFMIFNHQYKCIQEGLKYSRRWNFEKVADIQFVSWIIDRPYPTLKSGLVNAPGPQTKYFRRYRDHCGSFRRFCKDFLRFKIIFTRNLAEEAFQRTWIQCLPLKIFFKIWSILSWWSFPNIRFH